MKNKYETPSIRMVIVNTSNVFCGSPISSPNGIGYGGVDREGNVTPESRRSTEWSDFEGN